MKNFLVVSNKEKDPDNRVAGSIEEYLGGRECICSCRCVTHDNVSRDELEKAVERYLKGEPEPVTPAEKENKAMSTDTTRSSEKQTEQSKEDDPEIENTDPPVTEATLFDAAAIETSAEVASNPALTVLDNLPEGNVGSSYEDKITEITEESKSFEDIPDMDPSVGPDIK